jgi:hypothetical protein
MEWVEWTWNDCKDWYRQELEGWLFKKTTEPDSFTTLDEAILQDSIRTERNMIALIEALEKFSEFDKFSKFVSHNTLQLYSQSGLNLNILTLQQDIYHLHININRKIEIVDAPLEQTVTIIRNYLRPLNPTASND